MTTVAIISEYNPFHTGHAYQIGKIREEFGEDTRIVAVMSGNYTQRGEIAILDKYTRAECAVRAGINLVLELPFPYSMSSAEFFARAGVKIANTLGVVDYLSFGAETADVKALTAVAKNMTEKKFAMKLSILSSDQKYKALGYPRLMALAYSECFTDGLGRDFFKPNNILALEYIKALILEKSRILPHTVLRLGADYNEEKILDTQNQSASAIRELMRNDFNSALNYIPNVTKSTILRAYENNEFPTDCERVASALITSFRLNSPEDVTDIHDAKGGLYNRLYEGSFKVGKISDLITLTETKKYTRARIRRSLWYSFFGVTSSKVKELPEYTQILAMDEVGQKILKEAKKMTDFPILTKPSRLDLLSEKARRQKELSDKADSIFHLAKPCFFDGKLSLKTTPYVKKTSTN